MLSGVNAIDASGLDMLAAFHDELQRLGIRLHLAEIKGPVQDHLERSDLLASIGAERLYLSTQAAVEALASDSRAG